VPFDLGQGVHSVSECDGRGRKRVSFSDPEWEQRLFLPVLGEEQMRPLLGFFQKPLVLIVLVPGCRDLLFIDPTGQYSLQVFYMSSLLRPTEFSDPVSTVLEFSLCKRAFWTPRREDRITLMSRNVPPSHTKFGIFDMKLEEIGNKVTIQGKP
jgi:hypothetical protein